MSQHVCHWPGCGKPVPPKLWGCKSCWYKLPKFLRDKIWRHYRPGQEIDKRPSREYLDAAHEVEEWILKNYPEARKKSEASAWSPSVPVEMFTATLFDGETEREYDVEEFNG